MFQEEIQLHRKALIMGFRPHVPGEGLLSLPPKEMENRMEDDLLTLGVRAGCKPSRP